MAAGLVELEELSQDVAAKNIHLNISKMHPLILCLMLKYTLPFKFTNVSPLKELFQERVFKVTGHKLQCKYFVHMRYQLISH